MKRFLIILTVVIVASIGVYLYMGTNREKPSEKTAPIRNTDNSAAVNESFENVLNQYYSLKDALVASDTSKASAAAISLTQAASTLDLDTLKGDSTGMIRENAKSFADMIAQSAQNLANTSGLEEKRQVFETITDPLWNLTRTINYDRHQVYYQYCPMAFDDRGAYWLSRESAVLNPYFGDKMLKCGSVEDSLRFSN